MKKYILTERTNLFEPNVYIELVVTLSGNIKKEEIENAVRHAYTRNESTMSKVVLQKNGEAFYEQMDHSGCIVYYDDRDYESIIRENEKNPFDIQNGEMVRTFIIPKVISNADESSFMILIMAHHLVGDGQSILIFLQDVLDILMHKTVNSKSMELVDPRILLKRFHMPLYIRAFCHSCNRKWKREGRIFTWDDYNLIHEQYWKNHHSEIIVHTYSLEEIKRKCPQGNTVNTYLVTKLAEMYPDSACIGIPVSIREQSCSMSNQTSGIEIGYSYNTHITFEENAKKVQGLIDKKLHNRFERYMVLPFISLLHPTLLDAVIMQAYGVYENDIAKRTGTPIKYYGDNTRDLGITNLMKVNLRCDSPDLHIMDILFIPPKVVYSKRVIGLITYEDKTHVCIHNMVEDRL